jgi:peptidoglycan/xylan/chitin deacetylase (PgdA/CDA1 family)
VQLSQTGATDRQVLAVLGFHKIGEPPAGHDRTWFYVPEETFTTYLSYLKKNGWSVLDLAAFLHGLSRPHLLPSRAALLTFDDGYQSVLDVALPWLKRFDFPAVSFVPTAFVGGVNAFDKGVEPEERICDWAALRELDANGVAIQPHGVSHTAFSEMSIEEQETEVLQSKAVLEAELGRPATVFSYPYGDCGTDATALHRIMRASGYQAACLFDNGPNRLPIENPYLLNRIAIGPDTNLAAELGA